MSDMTNDPLRWMLEVAEARIPTAGPRVRTVNLKFTRRTFDMWREAARSTIRPQAGGMGDTGAEAALRGVLDWIESCTAPNNMRRYSRCVVCDHTWSGDKEAHGHRCPVPKWQAALPDSEVNESERVTQ